MFTHEMPEVNVTAFEHASLAGCANETEERTKLKIINNTKPEKEKACRFLFISKD